MTQKITPFLWFDDNAEEAVNFYATVFDNSKIHHISRYPEGSPFPAGTAMGVSFELDGQPFEALNGGPEHPFTEAISLFVRADTQEEIDRLWDGLVVDGGSHDRCGWLKDRFGLSWQIVPPQLGELLGDPDPERAGRVMGAMMQMTRIVIAELEAAAEPEAAADGE